MADLISKAAKDILKEDTKVAESCQYSIQSALKKVWHAYLNVEFCHNSPLFTTTTSNTEKSGEGLEPGCVFTSDD